MKLYSQLLTSTANARIPQIISNLLGGAKLIALKQGIKTIPIALGYSIRKDATSYITQSESTKQIIVNHLSPIQTGIGIPNGTEKIINEVNASLQLDNTLHTLQSDNINAFNSIERTHILSAYKTILPSAYPFISALMATESLLWMSTSHSSLETITSSCGSQQGDVAGSLSYALGLHPFLPSLDEILRNNKQNDNEHHVNKCYVDDGILRASTESLLLALDYYLHEGPKDGTYLCKDITKILLGKCATNNEPNDLHLPLTDS